MARIPAIPTVGAAITGETRRILNAVTEVLRIGTGERGDPLDKFVTLRDLYDSGYDITISGRTYTGGGGTGGGFLPPPGGDTEPLDPTPVGAPTGLIASGGLGIIILDWDPPSATNFDHTEIWKSSSSTFDQNAYYVGETEAAVYTDSVGTNETWYYWIRHVNTSDIPGPYNDIIGTGATSARVSQADLEDFSVDTQQLAANAVDLTKFASGLAPVEILGALPGTGNYEGRMVYLTTDNKLYRYTGSAWSSATAAADITGQLANSQISDLAAGKITGQLVDSQIANLGATKITGTLTETQIANDSISTPKLQANAVTADKILANTIVASKMAISDWSNMNPDYDMRDETLWVSPVSLTYVSTSAVNSGQRRIVYAQGETVDRGLDGPSMPCEPNKEYYCRGGLYFDTTRTTATLSFQLAWYSLDAAGAETLISRSSVVTGITSTSSSNVVSGIATAPATARVVKLRAVRVANGDASARASVGGMVCRRAAAGELIVDGTITGVKVQAGSIDGDRITAGTLDADRITAGQITTTQIQAGGINGDRITAGTVAADRLVANSITAGQIAAGAIGADQIAARAIMANHLVLSLGNDVPNGDFSQGSNPSVSTPAGWYAWMGGTANNQAVINTTSGVPANAPTRYVYKMNFTALASYLGIASHGPDNPAGASAWRGVKVEEGEKYLVSCWASVPTTTGNMDAGNLRIYYLKSDGVTSSYATTCNYYTACNAAKGTWIYFSQELTIPADVELIYAAPYGRLGSGSIGPVYLADVRIQKKAGASLIVDGSITGNKIAANTVQASNMLAGTITAASGILADAVITNGKIANLAVDAAKIANATITGAKIASATIAAANIANATITSTQIASATITQANMGSASIGTAQIIDANVSTLKIAGQAVTIPGGASSGDVLLTALSWTSLASVTFTSSGAPNSCTAVLRWSKGVSSPYHYMRLMAGATQVWYKAVAGTGLGNAYDVEIILDNRTPGSGSITWALQAYRAASTGGDIPVNASLQVLETKR